MIVIARAQMPQSEGASRRTDIHLKDDKNLEVEQNINWNKALQ